MIPLNNIPHIAKIVALSIQVDDDKIIIRHRIGFNQATMGILFFLCGGIFLMMLPFMRPLNTTSITIALIGGLIMALLSLLSLIREASDGIRVDKKQITWRYNLKKSSLPVNTQLRMIMNTETRKIRRTGGMGSDWTVVTCFLKTGDKEVPVLQFQVNQKYTSEAIQLGHEVIGLINSKLQW